MAGLSHNADRIEILAVEDLDADDRPLAGLQVLLEKRRAIGPKLQLGQRSLQLIP